jgi:glycosyltransferase involved in cell wall biosynthesis
MRLRIGFLTERLVLGFGVDLVVHQYASFLHEMGHEVTVFCRRHEPLVVRKYNVVDFKRSAQLALTRFDSLNIIKFARFFNASAMDVWIVNTPPYYDVVPLLRAPCIVIEYGTPPSSFFPQALGRHLDASVAYRFRYVFSRLRHCDRILCISRSIQDWLPKGLTAFSEVLYLGCDHYRKGTGAEARSFRAQSGVTDGEVLVLWVGRVQIHDDEQPYKGFLEFVQIAEEVMRRMPGIKFMVVGRGGEEEAAFLQKKGIIANLNLADDKMGVAYAAADIFLNTSKWEGFNLPLLEAQFQGAPVLAYNQGPHPEVCRNGETGFLVDDLDSMVEQLIALSRDRVKRAEFAHAAVCFATDFSWQRSCGGLKVAIDKAVLEAAKTPDLGGRCFVSGPGRVFFVALDTYRRYGFGILCKGLSFAERKLTSVFR